MTDYKCGHKSEPVFMNNDIFGFLMYELWRESEGFDGDCSLCFPCYCKRDKERIEKDKKENPHNWCEDYDYD